MSRCKGWIVSAHGLFPIVQISLVKNGANRAGVTKPGGRGDERIEMHADIYCEARQVNAFPFACKL